jgi:hypothetical protein
MQCSIIKSIKNQFENVRIHTYVHLLILISYRTSCKHLLLKYDSMKSIYVEY